MDMICLTFFFLTVFIIDESMEIDKLMMEIKEECICIPHRQPHGAPANTRGSESQEINEKC